MTTAQAPTNGTNGHRVSPPPCSLPHSQEENQSKDSPNNNESPTPVPANAYHVPPTRYAPKAGSYRYDDTLDLPPETSPLPERCQFMFSDGRQCTMGRSEIHPSLCPYHSEREDQLFGTPSSGGSVVGAAFDLPELYSACRDLTTASGVNRALGQVFRLLAATPHLPPGSRHLRQARPPPAAKYLGSPLFARKSLRRERLPTG
jgi:hypothetical protein